MSRIHSIGVLAAIFAAYCTFTEALTCYESGKDGELHMVSHKEWTYCALVPSLHDGQGSGKAFGLGPDNDFTESYDHAFAMSNTINKILTVCVYEKYDFAMLNPKGGPEAEFMFRCVCNYDLCNSRTTFNAYLSNMKLESMIR